MDAPAPITDLKASRFHLFEDGEEQAIKSCSNEDVPVSMGLVLDTSGSMSAKLGLLKQAAIQFVRAANPYDEYFLVEFQQRPKVVLPFTTDIDQLLEAIGRMEAGGSTPLFDAVHLAVNEMRNASYPRKALLIVSDGIDNHSRHTQRETRRLISEIDFSQRPIGLFCYPGLDWLTRFAPHRSTRARNVPSHAFRRVASQPPRTPRQSPHQIASEARKLDPS